MPNDDQLGFTDRQEQQLTTIVTNIVTTVIQKTVPTIVEKIIDEKVPPMVEEIVERVIEEKVPPIVERIIEEKVPRMIEEGVERVVEPYFTAIQADLTDLGDGQLQLRSETAGLKDGQVRIERKVDAIATVVKSHENRLVAAGK